jgi:hypothetical protein
MSRKGIGADSKPIRDVFPENSRHETDADYTAQMSSISKTRYLCSVSDCKANADYEVVLYDFYPDGTVFFGRDYSCPFICAAHAAMNEKGVQGERKPRGLVRYPFTNRNGGQGFCIYRPLSLGFSA